MPINENCPSCKGNGTCIKRNFPPEWKCLRCGYEFDLPKNKSLSNKSLNLSKGIAVGIFIAVISSVFFVPSIVNYLDSQTLEGLVFKIDMEELRIDENNVFFQYNFSGLNHNNEVFTNDVTLKIIIYENDTLSVSDISYNPQNIIPEHFENMVYFTWDIIPKGISKRVGEINLNFTINRYKPEGNINVSSAKKPQVKLEIKDVGEFEIDEKPLWIFD